MQEYKEYHTDTEVHFQLFFTPAKVQEALSGVGPHQKLKLVGKASLGITYCCDHSVQNGVTWMSDNTKRPHQPSCYL